MTIDDEKLYRLFRRTAISLKRTFSYRAVPILGVPSLVALPPLNVDTLITSVDDNRFYGFDYSASPEIIAGHVITSVTIIPASVAGLTIGMPSINTAPFDDVAAGQLVIVQISGGVSNTLYTFASRAVFDDGSVVVIPGRMLKLASY